MSRARHWAPLLLALLLLSPAAAGAATPQTSLSEIEGEVMCPVCGTLLELAEAPQAQREKAFVKRLVATGASKEQIKDALVAEYGEEVLAVPEGKGFNISAYLVPVIAFVVAAVALAIGILGWRRSGGGPDERDDQAARGPNREDSERLDADLARYDL